MTKVYFTYDYPATVVVAEGYDCLSDEQLTTNVKVLS